MKFDKPIIYDELPDYVDWGKYNSKADLEREKGSLNSNLESYVRSITTEANNKPFYVCPLCGSGSKRRGTGAFKLYVENNTQKWKCFSCDKGGDLFDLIGEYEGKGDFSEQINRARELFPNSANTFFSSRDDKSYSPATEKRKAGTVAPQENRAQEEQQPKKLINYKKFYEECNSALNEKFSTSYRGISINTLNAHNVGYCKEWRHPKAPNSPATEVIILPTSRDSYTARAINPDTPHGERYKQVAGDSGRHFFNELALTNAKQPIWITEGEFDALSIIEAGGEAVALGSTSNARSFLSLLEVKEPIQPLIIATDNDEGGEKCRGELKEELEAKGIKFKAFSYPLTNCKDPNEILQFDRETLKRLVEEYRDTARKEYVNTRSIKGFMTEYRSEFSNTEYGKAFPTGFSILDGILNGGLREGLTVIGALSGLGKTTMLLQIANNIAEQGEDVIYFSLEMNKSELLTRTISRLSYQIPKKRGESATYSKSLIDLYRGKGKWNSEEMELICEALNYLEGYSEHLYIVDGIGEITLEVIRKTIDDHIKATGRKPLVFVDYLQIIVPEKDRNSDKMNTDCSVVGLKKISSKYHIPVIALSSFNRENYSTYVTMASFKESGGIEYTADILIGMQFPNAGATNYNYFAELGKQKGEPLYIDMLLLKYRQGSTKYGVRYVFQREYSCFEQIEKVEKDYSLMNKSAKGNSSNSKKK